MMAGYKINKVHMLRICDYVDYRFSTLQGKISGASPVYSQLYKLAPRKMLRV